MKPRHHKHLPKVSPGFWTRASATPLEPWFVSYSLLVPSAERFIIRSCRRYLDDPELPVKLRKDLQLCFFQEQQHALAGDEFQKVGESKIRGFTAFRKIAEFVNYRCLDVLLPNTFKVAAASAMEQMNSAIAAYGLENLDQVSGDPAFRQNNLWHFVEEIEHREVIFDLQTHLGLGRFHQVATGLLVFGSFCFWISAGSLIVMLNRPVSKVPGKNLGVRDFWSTIRIAGAMFSALKRYLKAGFHPRHDPLPHGWESTKMALN
jgi:predicted metal-dependent hydrolase